MNKSTKRKYWLYMVGCYFIIAAMVVAVIAGLYEAILGKGISGAMIIRSIIAFPFGIWASMRYFSKAKSLKEGDW